MKDTRCIGYVRLSREDLRGHGATEEKLAARARMCVEIAERHGLTLHAADILIERESGATLHRSEIQKLLTMAREGSISHVVTPYQDRLSRGNKRDIQEIEDALAEGGVILVTTEGVVAFDDDFDEKHGLIWDVRGAVARAFARDLVNKRKVSDRERLKRNIRSRSYAPYGYRYLRAVRDGYGRIVTEQSYEVIPEEYVVLEEFFQRLRTEAVNAIANDFNARGIPTPAVGRVVTGGRWWSRSTLKRIGQNPFYAGYYAQQTMIRRGKRVWLAPEDYILADEEGDWPHPITLADWQENCQLIQSRRGKKVTRAGLLTGVLYCPWGRTMTRDGSSNYGCRCSRNGEPHRGGTITADRIEGWVADIVWAVIRAIPPADLTPSQSPTVRQKTRSEYQIIVKEAQAQRERVKDLMLQGSYYAQLFGRDRYEEACAAARSALDTAEARRDRVKQEIESSQPDTRPLTSLQERLIGVGFGEVWEGMERRIQREIVRLVIGRIDLAPIPEGKRNFYAAKVTLLPWLRGYRIKLPPLPSPFLKTAAKGSSQPSARVGMCSHVQRCHDGNGLEWAVQVTRLSTNG